jgi:hypothetical protein
VTKKTTYEIQLPASALGLTPPLAVGTKFGLGMAINDGDKDTPGQRGWGGLGAHAIVFGKSPTETALISLGSEATGEDRLFLAAISPDITSFSFRANDKGSSIVSTTGTKLTIDGKVVTLTSKPKVGDATDFTYVRTTPFSPGSHSYLIEAKDTLGHVVTDSGTFQSPNIVILTAAQQATSVDKSKPGFLWNAFQNDNSTFTTLDGAELALAGALPDGSGGFLANLADPANSGIALGAGTVAGSLVKFEVPSVVNFSVPGPDGTASYGYFTPDDILPGIPGVNGISDGTAAEVISFVELPSGVVTLGVRAYKQYRLQAAYINKVSDALVIGEGDGSVQNTPTLFKVFVQDAGIYPIRTLLATDTGASGIELFGLNATGDKVLINDLANGGYKAYRSGTAPDKLPFTVVGTPPPPLKGTPLTGIVVSTLNKTITADLPSSGIQGYLTITPSVTITGVKIAGGKLIVTYR